MGFDREAFDACLKDIENYVGYLKGNELAYEYLMLMWKNLHDMYANENGHPHTLVLEWEYMFPCPEGRFRVRPGVHWSPGVKTDPERPLNWDGYIREVQVQTDKAYREGLTWAEGLAAYLRSVCDQFVKPDVEVLTNNAIDRHRDVVTLLQDATNDDWANLGLLNANWHGAAATSFNIFYQNFDNVIDRLGAFCAAINVGVCLSAAIVDVSQKGAFAYVEGVRKDLVLQLDKWAAAGWKPYDPPAPIKLPEWVREVLDVADKALTVGADYVPDLKAVTDARGKAKNIADLVKSVAALANIELPKGPPEGPVHTSSVSPLICGDLGVGWWWRTSSPFRPSESSRWWRGRSRVRWR